VHPLLRIGPACLLTMRGSIAAAAGSGLQYCGPHLPRRKRRLPAMGAGRTVTGGQRLKAVWIRTNSPRLSIVSSPTSFPPAVTGRVWQSQSLSLSRAVSSMS
jgi:hypothetical protein